MDITVQDLLTITTDTDYPEGWRSTGAVTNTVTLRFGGMPVWQRSEQAEAYDEYAMEKLRDAFVEEIAKLLSHTFMFTRTMEHAAARADGLTEGLTNNSLVE